MIPQKELCVFDDLQTFSLPKSKPAHCKEYLFSHNKNIFRYIIRKSLKCALSFQYKDKVKQICFTEGIQVDNFYNFVAQHVESISGQQYFRQMVSNLIFRNCMLRFIEWFLRERYIRYIGQKSRMQDKVEYIKYKNRILRKLLKSY